MIPHDYHKFQQRTGSCRLLFKSTELVATTVSLCLMMTPYFQVHLKKFPGHLSGFCIRHSHALGTELQARGAKNVLACVTYVTTVRTAVQPLRYLRIVM